MEIILNAGQILLTLAAIFVEIGTLVFVLYIGSLFFYRIGEILYRLSEVASKQCIAYLKSVWFS